MLPAWNTVVTRFVLPPRTLPDCSPLGLQCERLPQASINQRGTSLASGPIGYVLSSLLCVSVVATFSNGEEPHSVCPRPTRAGSEDGQRIWQVSIARRSSRNTKRLLFVNRVPRYSCAERRAFYCSLVPLGSDNVESGTCTVYLSASSAHGAACRQ